MTHPTLTANSDLSPGPITACLAQGRFPEAARLAHRALVDHPTDPDLWTALGHAVMYQGKLAQARSAFGEALKQSPTHPAAAFGMATTYAQAGDLEAACNGFRSVLDRHPSFPGYLQLASIQRFSDRHDPDFVRIRDQLKRTRNASGAVRRDVAFAYGKALDDLGDYDQAFSWFETGNRLTRDEARYDIIRDLRFMRQVATLFDPAVLPLARPPSDHPLRPIFLIGLPRSGTTLLECMMAAHSQIRPRGERPVVSDVAARLGRKWTQRPSFVTQEPQIVLEDLRWGREYYLRHSSPVVQPVTRYTEKSPANFLYVGLIQALLPGANIIHLRRHPLDVGLACYRQQFLTGLYWSCDLGDFARYYRAYDKLMRYWHNTLSSDAILDIRYEELAKHPEATLKRIFAYCNLDYERACLEFYRHPFTVTTASMAQVRQPISTRNIGHWRRYRKHLGILATELADLVRAYEKER